MSLLIFPPSRSEDSLRRTVKARDGDTRHCGMKTFCAGVNCAFCFNLQLAVTSVPPSGKSMKGRLKVQGTLFRGGLKSTSVTDKSPRKHFHFYQRFWTRKHLIRLKDYVGFYSAGTNINWKKTNTLFLNAGSERLTVESEVLMLNRPPQKHSTFSPLFWASWEKRHHDGLLLFLPLNGSKQWGGCKKKLAIPATRCNLSPQTMSFVTSQRAA